MDRYGQNYLHKQFFPKKYMFMSLYICGKKEA